MRKCSICKTEEITWTFQPLGPGEDAKTAFVLPGSHYRGFPAIGVCYACKANIEGGEEVQYTYKGRQYTTNKPPRPDYYPADLHTDLWDGGTGLWNENGTGQCTMICRDIEGVEGESHDIVALVVDPALAQLFITAPQLLVCAEVLHAVYESQGEALGQHYEAVGKALGQLAFTREVITS